MAMAYGDQLTNMLQPFWALPLLGITGLKARDILPYTLLLMVVAGAVMLAGMLMWGRWINCCDELQSHLPSSA